MASPKHYLVRMLVFVAAVLAVAALLAGGIVNAFMANPALNGVIVGLLVVGVLLSFRSVLRLGQDAQWLRDTQTRGSPSAGPEESHPHLLVPIARLFIDQRGQPIMSAMAMRSLLDGIRDRLDEGREIARYLVGLLIFLGLLGTFWGLLVTIGAVGHVIGELSVDQGDLSDVFAELQQGLEAPLSGMGTAFSSSLFGLAGSLVLGFLELQVGQAQNRFYNELEDWLSGAVRLTAEGGIAPLVSEDFGERGVPAYYGATMEQMSQSLFRLTDALNSAEEGRRGTNSSLVGLSERLMSLEDHLRTQQTVLLRLNENQATLKPVLTALAEAAASNQFGIDDETRRHLRRTEEILSRMWEEMPNHRAQTVAEIRSEIKVLARTIAALAEEPIS